jgi:phosphoglycolate phosphatase
VLGADAIVFDLDGTLWDTCAACAVGWNRVLERHAIRWRPITADDVRRVTGKPHDVCIRESFPGLAGAELALLTEHTQTEDVLAIKELGGDLYPGVSQGLQALHARYPLFIVSNCQAGYIEAFFQTSGLGALFRDFECWGNTRMTKAENLRALIARNNLRAPLLVGDTDGDRQAAIACGVPFVHAAYGFGGSGVAADKSIGAFSELLALVFGSA